MASYSTVQIARIICSTCIGREAPQLIEYFLTDSRKLVFPERTLFVAIQTKKRDGHAYIDDLYKRGVRNFLVSEMPTGSSYNDALFLMVDDTISAFQQLAVYHRSQFDYPVIGITGSNGKTIVKEWANHLLHHAYNIVRSPRSYNSQLGVPLSILQMTASHELALFEAGISQQGEMESLVKIIHPNIGLITNIGEAHNEGFHNKKDKLQEKLKLFSTCHTIVYCRDHTLIHQSLQAIEADKKTISWGYDAAADIVIKEKKILSSGMELNLDVAGENYHLTIPYTDHAAMENAMHCVALLYVLGKLRELLNAFGDLPPLSMRLEMKEGLNQCLVINDSYNADLNGLQTAVEFMSQQADKRKRTIIMSDISGIDGSLEEVYHRIASLFVQHQVAHVIGIGAACNKYKDYFVHEGIATETYLTVDELLRSLYPSSFKDEVILLKGSRSFRFERISQLFEKKLHQTRLEIDLGAIAHNIRLYKQRLKSGTKIMAMVKAFSYGAGSYEIAHLLQLNGIDYLAVAYVDEGVELRKSGIDLPIMVMNTEEASFPALVEYGIEPEMYSIGLLKSFYAYLSKEGISQFPIHIKLDTGMHRLGFEVNELDELISILKQGNTFLIRSVFTHLVASEDSLQDGFTMKQSHLFDHICAELKSALGYPFLMHASNTAAIGRHSNLQHDMVRLGIGMYGIDTGNADMGLIEAATLKTTISQIREVKKGETVGYGRKAILQRDSLIATVRIGYADGYPRSLGNGVGKMLIKNQCIPTVGNVCMDMTMLDITDHPEIEMKDEVIVFGDGYSVQMVALDSQTIPYEIMTGISQRVPRIYFGE